MDKVSIILPVYNGEKFLVECLDSISNQSFSNYEVIMIDDCSSDSSSSILKRYAEKDSRFKFYRNEANGGLSYSRNVGVSLSTGQYFFFLDADDVLDPQCLKRLTDVLIQNGADISICGYEMFEDEIIKNSIFSEQTVLTNFELIEELAICSKIQNFAWGKLYKKELFNQISFPNGRYYEDICTTPRVFGKATRAVFIEDKLYYYRQNPSSISKTLNSKKINDYFLSMEEKGKYLLNNYRGTLKYMSQSFFDLFMLAKKHNRA